MKTKAQFGFHMHLLRLVFLVEQLIEAICLYENKYIPHRTIVVIGINVCEIRDCQNCERFEPTKISSNNASCMKTTVQQINIP